jgi:tetratricopeptide (TPR) repeat protein
MHERIWPDVKAYCARVGATVGVSHLVLDHEGYEGDQQHKHARNLPLLRKALREDPTRVFSWCHLASTHLALGRPRSAERAWKTALGIVRRKHQLQPDDSLPYVGLVQWTSASGGRAISLLDEALERFPRHAQLKWLQGRILMTDEKFESAIAVFEQLVDCGERKTYDQAIAYDTRLFNVLAYDSLATCHFRLRRYDEAGLCFERALACDRDNREYKVKRDLCARLSAAGSGSASPQGGSQ